jgi:hypothetical protein
MNASATSMPGILAACLPSSGEDLVDPAPSTREFKQIQTQAKSRRIPEGTTKGRKLRTQKASLFIITKVHFRNKIISSVKSPAIPK